MTTHVFVVDKTTFKLHLEYLFAGTGAGNHYIDFNDSENSNLHPSQERNLVSMIADFGRIRRGDFIIFYVQRAPKAGLVDGKFYGIFRATQGVFFLDNNDENQYLRKDLEKSLTFRILIEPYRVYANGVTEWEALDEIKNISSPSQMLWSLIYRKLKASRGNTMITIYESERLCQLIRNKNNATELEFDDNLLSYNINSQKIIVKSELPKEYTGRREEINIFPRLKYKFAQNHVIEVYLQAYITKNIGLCINETLDRAVLDGKNIEWLGNEVYCSVGMRKMDILLSLKENEQKILVPIELKSVPVNTENLNQLQKYIEWLRQYYVPNRPSDIQPVLITKKSSNTTTNLMQNFRDFNRVNTTDCKKLKFIET